MKITGVDVEGAGTARQFSMTRGSDWLCGKEGFLRVRLEFKLLHLALEVVYTRMKCLDLDQPNAIPDH